MTTTRSKKRATLRAIDERELRCVRGGMLYPAVKLLDTTLGVLASDFHVRFDGIKGEANS